MGEKRKTEGGVGEGRVLAYPLLLHYVSTTNVILTSTCTVPRVKSSGLFFKKPKRLRLATYEDEQHSSSCLLAVAYNLSPKTLSSSQNTTTQLCSSLCSSPPLADEGVLRYIRGVGLRQDQPKRTGWTPTPRKS